MTQGHRQGGVVGYDVRHRHLRLRRAEDSAEGRRGSGGGEEKAAGRGAGAVRRSSAPSHRRTSLQVTRAVPETRSEKSCANPPQSGRGERTLGTRRRCSTPPSCRSSSRGTTTFSKGGNRRIVEINGAESDQGVASRECERERERESENKKKGQRKARSKGKEREKKKEGKQKQQKPTRGRWPEALIFLRSVYIWRVKKSSALRRPSTRSGCKNFVPSGEAARKLGKVL